MNRKKHGLLRRSRNKLTREKGDKGKISIRRFLQTFKEGDQVQFIADPSHQRGMFHLRFYGKKGTVVGQQGDAYRVVFLDQTKEKTFIVNPVHLKRL
jgi:large subunit ribosomal protein L21e